MAPGNPAYAAGDHLRFTITGTLAAKSDAAQDLVRQVRSMPGPGGASVVVGGEDARFIDTVHAIGAKLPIAIGLIVLTTFIVLFLFTGSIVLPIKALILNTLSLTATFGAMVWIFQEGHVHWLFPDLTTTGYLVATMEPHDPDDDGARV